MCSFQAVLNNWTVGSENCWARFCQIFIFWGKKVPQTFDILIKALFAFSKQVRGFFLFQGIRFLAKYFWLFLSVNQSGSFDQFLTARVVGYDGIFTIFDKGKGSWNELKPMCFYENFYQTTAQLFCSSVTSYILLCLHGRVPCVTDAIR